RSERRNGRGGERTRAQMLVRLLEPRRGVPHQLGVAHHERGDAVVILLRLARKIGLRRSRGRARGCAARAVDGREGRVPPPLHGAQIVFRYSSKAVFSSSLKVLPNGCPVLRLPFLRVS